MGPGSRGAKGSKGQGSGDRELLNAQWCVGAAAAPCCQTLQLVADSSSAQASVFMAPGLCRLFAPYV